MSGSITALEGDITGVDVEVIVNAANSGLMGGGGVDGAIHRAAGPGLHEACMKIRAERTRSGEKEACPAGEAVLTEAFRLPHKGIIHTVGPVWYGGGNGEAELLASCYRKSLLLAEQSGFVSIAFPNISTGVYGYPKDKAALAAVTAVRAALPETSLERVVFVCFDRENLELYRRLV